MKKRKLRKFGEEVLEKYRIALETENDFDVIIMDLTIPGGMGGIETIRALKKIDPDVVALISSGTPNGDTLADYDRYGFAGVISKPYKVKDISILLHNIIAKK